MQSHIRKVYACLAVTCHLHFWQHDRDLLRATAVTRGVERIPKSESAQKVDPGEENSPAAPAGIFGSVHYDVSFSNINILYIMLVVI